MNDPIGRMKFAQKKESQVYSVEDSSDEDVPKEISTAQVNYMRAEALAKQQKVNNTINKDSKSRIEAILGVRRKTVTTVIDGVSYTLQSLKLKETREILDRLSAIPAMTTISYGLYVKQFFLAYSLVSIDGVDVASIFGGNDIETKIEGLEEFDDNLLDLLWEQYQKNKPQIKTEKEFKEVSEDLKG